MKKKEKVAISERLLLRQFYPTFVFLPRPPFFYPALRFFTPPSVFLPRPPFFYPALRFFTPPSVFLPRPPFFYPAFRFFTPQNYKGAGENNKGGKNGDLPRAAVAQTAHTNNPHLFLHSSSSSFDDTYDSG